MKIKQNIKNEYCSVFRRPATFIRSTLSKYNHKSTGCMKDSIIENKREITSFLGGVLINIVYTDNYLNTCRLSTPMSLLDLDHKSMVALDPLAKVQLNEIKIHLLKMKKAEPNVSSKTSYRAIVRQSIDELHKRLIVQ